MPHGAPLTEQMPSLFRVSTSLSIDKCLGAGQACVLDLDEIRRRTGSRSDCRMCPAWCQCMVGFLERCLELASSFGIRLKHRAEMFCMVRCGRPMHRCHGMLTATELGFRDDRHVRRHSETVETIDSKRLPQSKSTRIVLARVFEESRQDQGID